MGYVDVEYSVDTLQLVGKNGMLPGLLAPVALPVGNEPTSHGSTGRPAPIDDEHDGEDDEGIVPFLHVAGKLDMGKSGLIFSVFASAFSCRRHFARRF